MVRHAARDIKIGARDDVVDHSLQAHGLAVFRRIETGDAILVQFSHLLRRDDPAAAAENLDLVGPSLAQQIEHIFEELDMPALVGRYGDAVHVLLDGRGNDLIDRSVVAEMDHFDAGRLQQAAHEVNRRVVAIEKARGCYEADLVLWTIECRHIFGSNEGSCNIHAASPT